MLVAGGSGDGGGLASIAELWDPARRAWINAGGLVKARIGHTATLLPDGTVLITGGLASPDLGPNPGDSVGPVILASAELYDPGSFSWIPIGEMGDARRGHTATLLPDGKVLVTGGFGILTMDPSALGSAELYDPSSGSWTASRPMNHARYGHTATLLPDGRVLVTGGYPGGGDPLTSAELYDPSSGSWTDTGVMDGGRGGHTATLLRDGRVLVAGGPLYDPTTGSWTATGSLVEARDSFTATLLADGQVLVAGGLGNNRFLASAELYDPASGSWTATESMGRSRTEHTATLLADGTVLVVGGSGDGSIASDGELYDPDTTN